MRRCLPYEIPVGQFGVFGAVALYVQEGAGHLPFAQRYYSADDLSDYETIFEVAGRRGWHGHLALLVQFA